MTAKLETQQLSKSFIRAAEELLVLDDINIWVDEGEFVSFVGASGCGKTTLLRVIDGLIPATGGHVLVDGQRVAQPGTDRAFVLQHDSLLPWRTVLRNVTFGLEVKGMPLKAAESKARDLLKLVGLEGFEDHYPLEVSGGMRQRVNLARALVVDPDILLMDEPFASLDAQTREVMQLELLRIWEQRRKTVLFVTHQIDEAVYLSDRVIVFSARPGRVKQEVRIDIPRPRTWDLLGSERFGHYVEKLRNMFRSQGVLCDAQDLPGLAAKGPNECRAR